MIDRSIWVKRPFRSWSEPVVIIQLRRCVSIRGRAEAGHDVSIVPDPDRDDLTDPAVANQLASLLVVRPRALLGAGLDDPAMATGDVDHPSSFAEKERERFLDVHVLAARTRHHGHQGMPVIGGRDDHRVDVAVIE